MLFHKGGIRWVITELEKLDFVLKEYPKSLTGQEAEKYLEKISLYTKGSGKDALDRIGKHCKNVIALLNSDTQNHFASFQESLKKLKGNKHADSETQRLIQIAWMNHNEVSRGCIRLEVELKEYRSKLQYAISELKKGIYIKIDQIQLIDSYRNNALEAAKFIELKCAHTTTNLADLHKQMAEFREIIRSIETHANKSHWFHTNMMSWF